MHIATIINLFLLPCLVTILLTGAILNIKYTKYNIYRQYLIYSLLFWAMVMCLIYIKFFVEGSTTISYSQELFSVPVLLLGIPCFISLVSFPAVILDASFRTAKRWIRGSMPLLIGLLIYFGYHIIAKIHPMTKYVTFADLWSEITSISVILRMAVIALFIQFIVRFLVNIWRVVPIYNQYILDNIADSQYDVDWLRPLVRYISLVSITYFTMLINGSPIINMIYIISLILLFFYIIEASLMHRISEKLKPLIITETADIYSDKQSIYTILGEQPNQRRVHREVDLTKFSHKLDHWMEKSEIYTHLDFTTDDIISEFPNLTHFDLANHFKEKGETFRAYARRLRIKHACEIIAKGGRKISSKQIYDKVGFSHYSSFSRSFVSVTNMSPSEFAKCSHNEQSDIIAKLKYSSEPTPSPSKK